MTAEAALTLLGENGRHGLARPSFDHVVEVDEPGVVASRETASDGALAAAGETDENQIHGYSLSAGCGPPGRSRR